MAHIRLHLQQADGGLPMVCMRCGEPATVLKSKNMSWYPRWIVVLILLGAPGLIIMLILALVMRKRARLQAPFCEQHQGHWIIRTVTLLVTTVLAIAIGVGAFVAFITLTDRPGRPPQAAEFVAPLLCGGSIVVFIAWLVVIAVVQNTAIRPDEITRTSILLNGVSEEFVNAVEEAEIERRVRLRQWEYEDEADPTMRRSVQDQQASPPRKGQSTDAIEEPRRPPAPPPDAFEE
jgi:hypothetical protein